MPRAQPRTVRKYSDECELMAVPLTQEPGLQVRTAAAAPDLAGERRQHRALERAHALSAPLRPLGR